MCTHMYTCGFEYTHTHVSARTHHTYIHIYMHAHYAHVDICIHVYTCVRTCQHRCKHTQINLLHTRADAHTLMPLD